VSENRSSPGASASKGDPTELASTAGCPWVRASGEIIRLIDHGSECYFLAVEFFLGRSRGVQKIDGVLKNKYVTAVTATEA
jgi:hypothetical protein